MAELTITGLRVLAEVARRGSFTAAAEALSYTQSAVSRQAQVCEKAVGTALFVRKARGVELTPAGQVLARHAEQLLAVVESAEVAIAGLRDRVAGRLVVGAYPTAAAGLMPRVIVRLRERHPALEVELRELSSADQVSAIRAGRLEVAVIAGGEGLPVHDLDGLRSESLPVPRRLGVALSHRHPLARHDPIPVERLTHETWIVAAEDAPEPQFGAWPGLEEPRIGHRASGWPTRLGLVAAGLGISVLPGLAADMVPVGVTWREVDDPDLVQPRRIVVLTREDRSSAAAAVLDAVAAEMEQLTDRPISP